MSKNRLRCALRFVAPFALLFLAACGDEQSAANTAQQVMDAKNPGVVGAIKNSTGASTGNPETDAALGAEDVVKKIEQSGRLEAEAIVARDKGDAATAQDRINAAVKLRYDPYVNITKMGIALQFGDKDIHGWFDPIFSQLLSDTSEARENAEEFGVKERQVAFVNAGIKESERALQVLSRMPDLMSTERMRREANAAAMASQFYGARAALNHYKEDEVAAAADRARAKSYEQRANDLKAGATGD